MTDMGLSAWRGYIDQLAPLAEKIAALSSRPHDEQWKADLYQFLYSQISVGYLFMISDPQYPEFIPYYNHIFGQGFPNPDDTLSQAVIEDRGIYQISGFRGSARIASLQLGGDVGSVARMIDDPKSLVGSSKGVFDLDSAILAEDGSFEILLSPERPRGYEGDWWKLEPEATAVIVRQRHYDWTNEVDGRFAIQRLDVPAAKPRRSARDIDKALGKISKYIEAYGEVSFDGPPTRHLRAAPPNSLTCKDYSNYGGLANQAFVEGMFELADDEALIIESDVPERCAYWGFHLTDDFWQSIDWVNRHSSLNGHSARIDSDGKLRIVASAHDPGVPNWLDTVGRSTGFVYGRWTDASDYPTPHVAKVKITDVSRQLPADTPVVTAEERDAAIRARRRAVQLRRRW
ncbi:DUF1214 domain-containing protein [Rhizorhabdus argentea]|uniref:DUF1214 domain-containing protein n=1 Tax=Rhizorhabdus argentea TaxID=1387174 RepID=UPI0030EC4F10